MSAANYDQLPVVACKYCKSLHIQIDENGNDICMKCGSVNDIDEFEDIEQYRQNIEGTWGI